MSAIIIDGGLGLWRLRRSWHRLRQPAATAASEAMPPLRRREDEKRPSLRSNRNVAAGAVRFNISGAGRGMLISYASAKSLHRHHRHEC